MDGRVSFVFLGALPLTLRPSGPFYSPTSRSSGSEEDRLLKRRSRSWGVTGLLELSRGVLRAFWAHKEEGDGGGILRMVRGGGGLWYSLRDRERERERAAGG